MTTRLAATISVLVLLMASACGNLDGVSSASDPTESAPTQVSDPIGQIVFMRGDPSEGVFAGEGVTYTVNADGSDLQQLFSDGPSAGPRWSPDGTEIHIFCCDDGMAAHLVDPQTCDLRTLPPPDPTLETFCGGGLVPRRRASRLRGVRRGQSEPERHLLDPRVGRRRHVADHVEPRR
jgi:hypothetical protein